MTMIAKCSLYTMFSKFCDLGLGILFMRNFREREMRIEELNGMVHKTNSVHSGHVEHKKKT